MDMMVLLLSWLDLVLGNRAVYFQSLVKNSIFKSVVCYQSKIKSGNYSEQSNKHKFYWVFQLQSSAMHILEGDLKIKLKSRAKYFAHMVDILGQIKKNCARMYIRSQGFKIRKKLVYTIDRFHLNHNSPSSFSSFN